VGVHGDCYDRYLVASRRCANPIASSGSVPIGFASNSGRLMIDDRKVRPPSRERMKDDMESLIHHFKVLYRRIRSAGRRGLCGHRGAKGEFGIYLISDGANKPYRLKCRAPGFPHLAALEEMCTGHMLADVVAVIGTQDMCSGKSTVEYRHSKAGAYGADSKIKLLTEAPVTRSTSG